jgi:Tol biopolymer transport system component
MPRTRAAIGLSLGVVVVVSTMTGGSAAAASGARFEQASVSSGGEPGIGSSISGAVSADGRFVAMESSAANLVPGDTNGTVDVFVRDRRAGTTERVSVSNGGAQVEGESYSPSISADGRYVAFTSWSPDLLPAGTQGAPEIFVRDRRAGTTELVSVSTAGVPADYECASSRISADGRFVAFVTGAVNLVAGDTNGVSDVFVRDRRAGTTERVSVSSVGRQADGASTQPAISADGRYVAFSAAAANLVRGDTNQVDDVFLRDRRAGTTTRVSVSGTGGQSAAAGVSPAISATGRYVVFVSYDEQVQEIRLRDRRADGTTRVSVSSTGQPANRASGSPSVSADGRFVAFESSATNLAPGDVDEADNVFVRDRRAGTTIGFSPPNPADYPVEAGLFQPVISDNGRSVAFTSGAPVFSPGAIGYQIIVRDQS